MWSLIFALALQDAPALQAEPSASPAAATAPSFVPLSLTCAPPGHQYGNTVSIEISSPTDARLRLPAYFVPPVHSGGGDGWWVVHNLRITDTAIDGHVNFNVFNNPNLHIDRTTGIITVNEMKNTYSGDCSKVDVTSARKF